MPEALPEGAPMGIPAEIPPEQPLPVDELSMGEPMAPDVALENLIPEGGM